jgi:tripartite-type tricarboxylate transporter receptor subunit TctC
MMRRLMLTMLLALAGLAATGTALADQYPSKPIRLIVPWPPAGVADVVGRLMAEKLTAELGQTVIVENRPGASGFIGTELVARAAPDGYTLLLVTASTHSIAPNLYRKMPYDAIRDFAPISQVTSAPTIMVTPANSPFGSVAALIAYAKANPGKLNYATYGAGGSSQLAAELFMQAAGIQMTAIPYKGATPAILGLMSGDVSLFFDSIPSALPHVRGGKLKALAVTGLQRTAAAPDLPTVAETFPGFEFIVWQGIEATAGTPKAAIDRLSVAMGKIMAMPEVRNKLRDLGADATGSASPEQFAQHIVRQKEKFAEVIKRANIGYLD